MENTTHPALAVAGAPRVAAGAARAPAGARDVTAWAEPVARLAAVALAASLAAIFLYAPTERLQGNVQRIFYVHVALAVTAFLAFFVLCLASALYLWRREAYWDAWAHAAAEVGALFLTLVLVTGSLWAKPVWGTWWTWDARLTTTFALWATAMGYLALRAVGGDSARVARAAAVVGVIAFADVPVIRQSVVWWRTLHPGPTIIRESGGVGLPAPMLATLALTLVAFVLLGAALLLWRLRLEHARRAPLPDGPSAPAEAGAAHTGTVLPGAPAAGTVRVGAARIGREGD